jgi:hypothetical protein
MEAFYRPQKFRRSSLDILGAYDRNIFEGVLAHQEITLYQSYLPSDAAMPPIGSLGVNLVADQQDAIRQIQLVAHPLSHISSRREVPQIQARIYPPFCSQKRCQLFYPSFMSF